MLLNDSSPQVVNMLPFHEVEVESIVPFQELGANFTFCCVAINREGNASDMFHSVTITSKIQTGSLVEWVRIWGLLGAHLIYIPTVLQERWNRFCKPSVFTAGWRIWHLPVQEAMLELLDGHSLVPKGEPRQEPLITAGPSSRVQGSQLLLSPLESRGCIF